MEILGLDLGELGGLFVIVAALLLCLPPVQRLICGPEDVEPDWWVSFDDARDETAWRSR